MRSRHKFIARGVVHLAIASALPVLANQPDWAALREEQYGHSSPWWSVPILIGLIIVAKLLLRIPAVDFVAGVLLTAAVGGTAIAGIVFALSIMKSGHVFAGILVGGVSLIVLRSVASVWTDDNS